jgi:hypothetical protein
MNQQPPANQEAKQDRAAVLLASGRAIKDAAAETGIGERTLHTWLSNPRFRAKVVGLRARLLDEATGLLAASAVRAVGVLRDLLGDPNPHVRLRAAVGILAALLKAREHIEMDERILRLEQGSTNGQPHEPA